MTTKNLDPRKRIPEIQTPETGNEVHSKHHVQSRKVQVRKSGVLGPNYNIQESCHVPDLHIP